MTNESSTDCISEATNAVNNGDTAPFCKRCRTEGGANPLRGRCRKCCDMCQSVSKTSNDANDPGTSNMTCAATAETSDDCDAEAANAVNNGNVAGFCERCVKEDGATPLRNRCKKCCDMCQAVGCDVGAWEGAWAITGSEEANDGLIGATGTMTLNLAVENFENLVGTGNDGSANTKFTINGKVFSDRMNFVKVYTTHEVTYTGTSDDGGVNYAGNWVIETNDVIARSWGTYTMKPPTPCVDAIAAQNNYKPATVQFTYETDVQNGFGSFSQDEYQKTVCDASASTSCESVANTFEYKVVVTYTVQNATSMTEEKCKNAIAAANNILPSDVNSCNVNALAGGRRLFADGRQLNAATATAGITMTNSEQAQAVASSVKDTNALKSALALSPSAPTMQVAPTLKVVATTKVAVPSGDTTAVQQELSNVGASLESTTAGSTASTNLNMQANTGAPTPPPPPTAAPSMGPTNAGDTYSPTGSPTAAPPTAAPPTPPAGNGTGTTGSGNADVSSAESAAESVLVALVMLSSTMWAV